VTEKDYAKALTRAHEHAARWLASIESRSVAPRASADALRSPFGGSLPAKGSSPEAVVDFLAEHAEPGLMAMQSGRFFGWVIGGLLPAGLAADWLVSAWDQNAGLRFATPAVAAIEEAAAAWTLDLLGLPTDADVGFVTGGTMANFTGLAAARYSVFERVGWEVHDRGLIGAPTVHVLVGEERHATIDVALRYLGLGRPTPVPADDQGRVRVDALRASLAAIPAGEPIIVCLQAGNLHSGAFDPFGDAIEAAHERGAWVHVDGAFGLWAAASTSQQHLVRGLSTADSWATDAHKTLNTPYDCGIAIVADPTAVRSAFGTHTSYLIEDGSAPGDPMDKVPELSRRARGVPVWAVLRSLGSDGVRDLVDGLSRNARAIAEGVAGIEGAEVLNDVVFTQVSFAFDTDERTKAVCARIMADGTAWMSGSRWRGRDVIRVSVSNWTTTDEHVAQSVEAVRQAAKAAQ
jgi:glutamate/tyrosine decarboxylase-like PLP-dependent enzyme